jgi:hypothetical protein
MRGQPQPELQNARHESPDDTAGYELDDLPGIRTPLLHVEEMIHSVLCTAVPHCYFANHAVY